MMVCSVWHTYVDKNLIISGSWDMTIKIWNFLSGQVIKTLTGHTDCVQSIALNEDSKLLVSGSWDETIKLWKIKK